MENSQTQEKSIPKLPEVKHHAQVSEQNRQKIASNSFTNDAAERYALFNEKQAGL